MGDNCEKYKNGKFIFYSNPRVKNKFFQKILLRLFGRSFGYKFLYKNKLTTPANFTIKTFDADDVPIDKEKFNGDIIIEL